MAEYPLKELSTTSGDRLAWWTGTHLKMFRFQCEYTLHRLNVLRERENTDFKSGVTEYPISPNDSNNAEQVAKMLSLHAKELRDQAAKPIEPFSASATIS